MEMKIHVSMTLTCTRGSSDKQVEYLCSNIY